MLPVNLVQSSHMFVAYHVKPGDSVIDATAGNGNDTLFLAKLVGSRGTVHAFDIQQTALDRTKALLEKHGTGAKLHLTDHSYIPQLVQGPVSAIIFNLGYLPGGDKSLTTNADNSIIALNNCLSVLGDNGIISVMTYSGHPAGKVEEEQVVGWCKSLAPKQWTVTGLHMVNRPNNPPKLWLIRRNISQTVR